MDLPKEASRGGSVPVILRQLIATCDLPGGQDPLPPTPGSAPGYGQKNIINPSIVCGCCFY